MNSSRKKTGVPVSSEEDCNITPFLHLSPRLDLDPFRMVQQKWQCVEVDLRWEGIDEFVVRFKEIVRARVMGKGF